MRVKAAYSSLIICIALTPAYLKAESSGEDALMLLYEDEEIISIATGTRKPIHLAPSVASVITAEDIKAMGATSLDEALEFVPGLHVARSFNRLNAFYSIRGIHSGENPQVLLLINGQPIRDNATGGRPPLFRLPVANISRIEVIRGPGSAVYGADAFAGVINVITKEVTDIDGTILGVRAGSFDTKDAWIQHGAQYSGWDMAFSLEYAKSDGDAGRIVNSDQQTTFDTFFGTNASLAPGPLQTQYEVFNTSLDISRGNWKLWFNSWNLRDSGLGPGGAQALDTVGHQEVDHYIAKLSYIDNNFSKNWKVDSHLVYREMNQDAFFQLLPPGTTIPIGSDGNINFSCVPTCMVTFTDGLLGNPGGDLVETSFEAALTYDGWAKHHMRIALGTEHDSVQTRESKNFGPGVIDGSVTPIDGTLTDVTDTANVFMPDKSRTLYYLSLQDEWKFAADWELTGGVRYDNYSDFGSTVNPRLALVWATDYNLTTKLLYGRAFRAPAFNELYFQNNPYLIGNENLDPETIDMLELAFDYRPNFDLETIFNIYTYQIHDLIDFINNEARNAKDQRGYGFEAEANWKLSKTLQILGNVAWQKSENADTNETVAAAPGHQLSVGARWKFKPNWSLNPRFNWVAARKRAASDTREDIKDYTIVDLILRYNIPNNPLEFAAAIRNALDEDAREPSNGPIAGDYPLEGRSVYIEAIYHFNK